MSDERLAPLVWVAVGLLSLYGALSTPLSLNTLMYVGVSGAMGWLLWRHYDA